MSDHDTNDAPASSTTELTDQAPTGGVWGFLGGLVDHKAASTEMGAPTAATTLGTY